MLHAKVRTVDGHIANVGSANFSSRSMALDEAINLVVLDDAVVATLDGHFEEDLERSVRLEPGRWNDRSRWQQGVESPQDRGQSGVGQLSVRRLVRSALLRRVGRLVVTGWRYR